MATQAQQQVQVVNLDAASLAVAAALEAGNAPSFRALAQHNATIIVELLALLPESANAEVVRRAGQAVITTRKLAATRQGAKVGCTTEGCSMGDCQPCEERDRLEGQVRALQKAIDVAARESAQ